METYIRTSSVNGEDGRQFCRKCLKSVGTYDTLEWDGGARKLHWCWGERCQNDMRKYL